MTRDDELEVCDPFLQIASMQADLSPTSELPASTVISTSELEEQISEL
jgi:hypothetical protein